MKPFILTFANRKNIYSENMENSLKKYNYSYDIIGEGMQWENFLTKIKGCYDYLSDNYNSSLRNYDLICIVDSFDILFCGPESELIQKFLQHDKDIVIGSENYIPLGQHWRFRNSLKIKNKDRSTYKDLNAGFYMGYKKDILILLKYILDCGEIDDQKAICRFYKEYPDKISLDTESEIIGNIQIFSYTHFKWYNNRLYNSKTNTFPCILHRPCIYFDFFMSYNYFGKKILGSKFLEESFKNKYTYINNKCKINLILISLFIIIVILLLLKKI